MGEAQTVDSCIRHEGKHHNNGVYVVVVMDGAGCPVEVQVSLAFPPSLMGVERFSVQGKFINLEQLANAWIACGGPIAGLIKFIKRPPCEMSGIIGDALIASLEE